MQELAAPTDAARRIASIDVIRGFALFGILAANIYGFALPPDVGDFTSLPDKLARFTVDTFIGGRFIILFTFLFGMGFALQTRRFADGDPVSFGLFTRRQLGLLGFGVLHVVLLSDQDILVFYALLGFALWPLRRASARFLVSLALIAYAVSFVPELLDRLGIWGAGGPTGAATALPASPYGGDDFAAIVRYRLDRFLQGPSTGLFRYLNKLPFFLLGFCAIRFGWYESLAADGKRLWRTAAVSALIGLGGRFALFLTYQQSAPDWVVPVRQPIAAFANPALSLCYASILLLIYRTGIGPRLLAPLAAAGRTALSNYILQSVVCTTLFFGYGFGFYGRFGPFDLMLLTLGVFVLQIALSAWWLQYFRMGPLEWIWRTFTYRKAPALRA